MHKGLQKDHAYPNTTVHRKREKQQCLILCVCMCVLVNYTTYLSIRIVIIIETCQYYTLPNIITTPFEKTPDFLIQTEKEHKSISPI